MERPSLEGNLPDTHEEGKLYVVDSLNNLNKLNVCPDESQRSLDEEENTVGAGESTARSNTRNQWWFFITFIFTLIISLALVSFVIFLIYKSQHWGHSTEPGIIPRLIHKSGYLKEDLRVVIEVLTGNWFGIQTRNEMDQISNRLLSEKKNIEELKKINKIILKHINQSGIKEKPSDLHDYLFTHAELKVPGE